MSKIGPKEAGNKALGRLPRRIGGMKHVAAFPPGSRIAAVGETLVAAHPEHPPQVVTADGLKELNPRAGYNAFMRDYMKNVYRPSLKAKKAGK